MMKVLPVSVVQSGHFNDGVSVMENRVKVVEYTFDDIQNIVKLLNELTVTGVNACAAITQIASILENGKVNNIVNKKENR